MQYNSLVPSTSISSDFVSMDIQKISWKPQIDLDTRLLVGEWKKCKALQDLVAEATEYMGRALLHKHEATDFKLRLSEAIWYYNDLFSGSDTPHWASAFRILL